MGRFQSGVTIVTALRDGVRHAMTATAISAVSLEPPLILVCVSRQSRFHAAITAADSWMLSVLSAGQETVARHFANRGRDLMTQFDQIPHEPGEISAAPRILGALAWAECRTWAQYDGGDHTIVVGQVAPAGYSRPIDESSEPGPLTYYRGTYSPAPT